MKIYKINYNNYFNILTTSNILYVFIGSILYLLQFIYPINYIITLLISFLIIITYVNKKYNIVLFFLLLYSALVDEGINIYTMKIFGINLFYMITFVLLSLNIFKNNKFSFSKELTIYMFLLTIVGMMSVSNIFESTYYWIKDFLLLVFIPIVFYILFKEISGREIMRIFLLLLIVKIFTTFLMFVTGLTLKQDPNMFNIWRVSNQDELGAFYIVLLLSLALFGKHLRYYLGKILLFISFIGFYVYGLAFLGLGSQIILLMLIVLLLFFFKNKAMILFSPLVLIIPFVFLTNDIQLENNSALAYKINNIVELVEHLNKEDIYLIPQSPQVRVIEMINLFGYPWYNIMFGHGLGGYFTDSYFPFNKWLGKFDYSEQEIRTRHFYNPHNLGYSVLKFGLLWEIFIFYLFIKAYRLQYSNIKIFVIAAIFVLFFNIGYGIKNSILFALIFIILHNEKGFYYEN